MAFTEITLPEDLVLEKQTLKAGTTLKEVVDVAIVDKQRSTAQAPLILDAVMKALEVQSQYVKISFLSSNQTLIVTSVTRHPVLLAVDEFQTLYGKTAYRDPHFVPIHSYHLSVPRLIMEYASGRRTFVRSLHIFSFFNPPLTFLFHRKEALSLGQSLQPKLPTQFHWNCATRSTSNISTSGPSHLMRSATKSCSITLRA